MEEGDNGAISRDTEQLPIELSKLSLEPNSQAQVSNAISQSNNAKINKQANPAASAASHALQGYQNSTQIQNSQPMMKNNSQLQKEPVEEESSEISASDDGSWISWFCALRGNEFFCEVDEDYIQDDFNLTGLHLLVPYYDYALDMVLDVEMPMEEKLTEAQQEIVESAAVSAIERTYGRI